LEYENIVYYILLPGWLWCNCRRTGTTFSWLWFDQSSYNSL